MKIVKLPKENLAEFICNLGMFGEIHAPIKRGNESLVFAQVKDASDSQVNILNMHFFNVPYL